MTLIVRNMRWLPAIPLLPNATAAIAGILIVSSAQAHNPSEHTNRMEKPKCEAMKNMDHSEMDPNDPVMIAMMKKCMGKQHSQSDQGARSSHNHKQRKMDQSKGGHNH